MAADFQRVTKHVIGSRADGEGPRKRSPASAIFEASTLGLASCPIVNAICGCEVPRRLARLGMTSTRRLYVTDFGRSNEINETMMSNAPNVQTMAAPEGKSHQNEKKRPPTP